jgi:hypothetical protein
MSNDKGKRPLTQGGRTLAFKKGHGGSPGAKKKRPTWWQSGKNLGQGRGKVGSTPCAD